MMSGLMSDVVLGSISPVVSNAAVNAGGKLLKAHEMEKKYASRDKDGSSRVQLVREDTDENQEALKHQQRERLIEAKKHIEEQLSRLN